MFYVYILQSKKDKSYYIGQTDNLERRLEEHNRGKNIYTKGKAPWTLVYKEFFDTRAEAVKRESEIKKKKRRSYIEWLIKCQTE
jgi:putative endonuclease